MRRGLWNALLLLAAVALFATCAAAASAPSTPVSSVSPRSLRRLLQAPSRAPRIATPAQVATLDDSEEEDDNAAAAPIAPDDGEGERASPSDALTKNPKPVSNDAAPDAPITAAAAGQPTSGPAPAASRSAATAANSNAPPPEDDDEDDPFPMMVGSGLGLQHSETVRIGEHNHEGDLSDPDAPAAAGNAAANPAATAAAAGDSNDPVPDVPPATTASVPAIPTGKPAAGTKVTGRPPAAGAKPAEARTPNGKPLKQVEPELPQDPAAGDASSPQGDSNVPADLLTPGHAAATSLAKEKAALDAQHKKEQEEEAALDAASLPPLHRPPPLSTNEPEEEEETLNSNPAAVQPGKATQSGPTAGAGSKKPVAPKPAAGVASTDPLGGVSAEEEAQPASPLGEPKPNKDEEPSSATAVQVQPKLRQPPGAQNGKDIGSGPTRAVVDRSPEGSGVPPSVPSSENPPAAPAAPFRRSNETRPANDETKPATNANSSNSKKNLPKDPPTQQSPVTPAPATGSEPAAEGEPEAPLVGGSPASQFDAKAAAAEAKQKAAAAALAAVQAKQAAAAKQAEEKAKAAAQAQALAENAEQTDAEDAAAAAARLKNKEGGSQSMLSGPASVMEEGDRTGPPQASQPSGAAAPKGKTDSNSTAPVTTATPTPVTPQPVQPKPVKPKPVSTQPKPAPTQPQLQPAPQMEEEEDPAITKPSAAAEAAAAGSGAVRLPENNTTDPEAVVPKVANTTTASTPKPSCTLRDARLSFVGGDLRLYVKIVQTAQCAVSDDLELRASLSMFESGSQNRCTHTMRLSSTEIKQASSGDDGYVILSADKTRSMVPEVRYNVEFTSCPALAQSPQECKPVARSKVAGSERLMRPATAVAGFGVQQAVRIVTSTAEKYRPPFDPALAGEDLSRSVIESLLQSSPDATASLRSLSAQRLLVSFVDHDDTDDTGTHVHFDVLPMPVGGAFTGETMEAPELAERVRCFLINKTKTQDTAQLKLIGPIVSIEQFDPCANPADAAACAIVRPPSAAEPTPVNPDSEEPPATTPKPSGPARPSIEDEFEMDQQDSKAPQRPKTPVEPTAPAKTPASTEEEIEDLVGAASAEELDAARADVPASTASTGYADQLSELLGGLNPLYAMGLVGAILAVTFWALCLRGGSSDGPRRTETAANMDQPDEELGGVEMAHGSSRHGGFAPLQNQDDDSSMSSATQPTPTLASVPSGVAFANEKEEGSASKFLISVLISIGIPSFGTAKYSQILKDNYLSRLDQLKQLDSGDWKRLGLPFVIEEALRKALLEHTNREGKFAVNGAGGSGGRAKGLDLKASGAKKATGSATKDKHKKGGLSVSALSPSPTDDADADLGLDLEDPFATPAAGAGSAAAEEEDDNDEPAVREEATTSSSGDKKKKGGNGKKKDKKASLLLAPPSNDSPAARTQATDDDAEDSADKKLDDDDWMSKF